jgi:hypothetical protein
VDSDVVAHDRELAPTVLRFFSIRAIIVHPAEAGPDVVPYVEQTMPVRRFAQEGATVGYWVDLPPWPEQWPASPGDGVGRLSYAEGWGLPSEDTIWAQRRAVRLLVPLQGGEATMAFRAYAPAGGQRIWIEASGWRSGEIDLEPGWQDVQVTLPLETGLSELALRFSTVFPARGVQLAARAIGTTGIEAPVNLAVQSAGLEVGNLAHIYVDGHDVAPNARGYNVAVIHPQTGQVEQVAAFDTHLDEGASQALADFLSRIPQGRIVAVAVADEAARLLGAEAVEALRGVGAAGDLREGFRWGHAVIGVQGAAPGTAAEAMDWKQPVSLVVGEGATEPDLAAALAEIRFEAATIAEEVP